MSDSGNPSDSMCCCFPIEENIEKIIVFLDIRERIIVNISNKDVKGRHVHVRSGVEAVCVGKSEFPLNIIEGFEKCLSMVKFVLVLI
jgi:hypothetical protein